MSSVDPLKSRPRSRGPYFRYRADSSAPVPRTSRWRSQNSRLNHQGEDVDDGITIGAHDDGDASCTGSSSAWNEMDGNDNMNIDDSDSASSVGDVGLPVGEMDGDDGNVDFPGRISSENGCSTADFMLSADDDGSVSDSVSDGDDDVNDNVALELDPALVSESDAGASLDQVDDFGSDFESVLEDLQDSNEAPGHNSEDQNDGKNDKPLYHGSRLTLSLSVLLIATFVMRHGLSGESVADLLTLIELHCLSDNICVSSLRLYNKFLSKLKSPVKCYYFCEHCSAYFGLSLPTTCHVCKRQTVSNGNNFFIMNPLDNALRSSFSRKDFVKNLRYRSERVKQHENNIEDVLDGDLYKRYFNPEGFFHGTSHDRREKEIHISFQINTDGVAIFKSNKTSMWPVYLVINELHPKLRYSRAERIFLGVWYGTGKPFFRTFMQPFAESFKDIFVNGIRLHANGLGDVVVRGIVLSAVMDSPARCTFQEFTQFNGNMGCPFCLSPGETVRTAEGGHTRAYPYNADDSSGHHGLRTHEQTVQFASEAQQTGKPVGGVKGHSWFLFVPKFNIIDSVAVDYMHGLILGVTKMLVSLWFEKCYHSEDFSIGRQVKEVDKRLQNISPPNCISRMPRNIETHIKFWKASEYRSFLLFYALPCLWGILPSEYFQHFLLLNESAFILLSETISNESLLKAEQMLKHFCLRIESLFGKRYQTWNVHSLLHYVENVRLLGPLWANSCFPFEDFNGDIKNLFHGTRGVCRQIVNAVCLQQIIPNFEASFSIGSSARAFYDHLMRHRSCKLTEQISVGVSVIGTIKESDTWPNLSIAVGHAVRKVYRFSRLFLRGMVIHSKSHWPGIKRNSFTIEFFKNDRQICYGQVDYFLKCYFSCLNPTCCDETCDCHTPLFFAVVQEFKCHSLVLSSDNYTNATASNILPVQVNSTDEKIINVLTITKQCVLVDIGDKEVGFVCRFPNLHEKD